MSCFRFLRAGVLAAVVGTALAGCATIAVNSQVNAALVHTVHCRSFGWAGALPRGPLSTTLANPVNEADLRAAISMHLQALGMRQVNTAPDCLVGYGIGEHNDWSGVYPYGWGWGWGWGGGPWGPWWGGPIVYPEAIIGVDLYEASGQPLWHADARLSLGDLRGANVAQGIDRAVDALFAKYPG